MVRRMDTQQALGSTGAMNRVMVEQRRRVEVRVAASCVGPLIEAVLCADAAEVDAEEFQRAGLLLCSLCQMDREVSAEYFRNDRFFAAWAAPGNVYNAAAAKDPAELTRDDAMTLCATAPSQGGSPARFDGYVARAGWRRWRCWALSLHAHPLCLRAPRRELLRVGPLS